MLTSIKLVQRRVLSIGQLVRAMSSNASSEIVFTKQNQVGCILLNRPKQLNALTLNMVKVMYEHLKECERDTSIKAVVVKGAGETAYCAGGDVKSVRDLCMKGEQHKALEFFREEYKLNYKIANMRKPYIALVNGITMGGGVGVSVHGRYRVATEKTVFAMPETAIGFFADVGGSYFLSRLRDNIGLYLVLTGHRLKGEDVKRCGIATHYLPSTRLAELEQRLFELKSDGSNSFKAVDDLISSMSQQVQGEFDTSRITANFRESSFDRIIANLNKDGSDWAKQQLKQMTKMSPTSLKVAVRQMEEGARRNLRECLEMEYQLCLRFTSQSDFMEGVRAVLIDRGDTPKWKPDSVEKVDQALVDWYFKPLPNDDKLVLPDFSKL